MTGAPFTTRPELVGDFGMVAASHWLAAQSGMAMLERGGNAFDAAAAAGFVLEVVEPHQNGLGGEAPMVLYSVDEGSVQVVDGQGPAPAAATPEHFSALGLDLVPGVGLLAACVPGAFGSWMLVLERFGTKSLREVLEPALSYAESGFPVLASLAATLTAVETDMRAQWPTSASIWLGAGGGVPPAGGRLRNPQLASTLRRLLAEGEACGPDRAAQIEGARAAYYEGFVAEAIDGWCTTAGSGGLLRGADLAGWRASLEEPARLGFGEFEVCKTGPWGQGPVFLQQLSLLAGFDLASMGAGSPDLVHVVTECAKLAFADREAFYGDPRMVEVPLADLLSPAYAAERRQLVGEEASVELRPGRPAGRAGRLPERVRQWGAPAGGDVRGAAGGAAGDVEGRDPRLGPPPGSLREMRGDTCHLDVADRFGNLVSATPSGGWLQSSPAVAGLGFCLGTRGQMFWLEEGLPASLVPGKRPRTTLSPGLALRDGRPYLAFGTPGGDQQDQWTLLAFLEHAVFGRDLQASIDAPSWHSNHAPSSFFPREAYPNQLVAERRLGEACLADLRRRGHDVVEAGPWLLGRKTAVSRSADGFVRAAADPRAMQAYAVGR
jgi:gamma-glutamyltranspeptidase/glutathione hydrolase